VKVKLSLQSEQLTKEELKLLLQGIRDCEQSSFPDKEISIWIEAPELSAQECEQLLASIRPPYKYRYGPFPIT